MSKPASFFSQHNVLLNKHISARFAARRSALVQLGLVVLVFVGLFFLLKDINSIRSASEIELPVPSERRYAHKFGNDTRVSLADAAKALGDNIASIAGRANTSSRPICSAQGVSFILGKSIPPGYEDRVRAIALNQFKAASPAFASFPGAQQLALVNEHIKTVRVQSRQSIADAAHALERDQGMLSLLRKVVDAGDSARDLRVGSFGWAGFSSPTRTLKLHDDGCPQSHACSVRLGDAVCDSYASDALAIAAAPAGSLPESDSATFWNTTLEGLPVPMRLQNTLGFEYLCFLVLFTLALMMPVQNLAAAVVEERETKLREYLFINGVTRLPYLFSFLTMAMVEFLIINCALIVVLFATNGFRDTSLALFLLSSLVASLSLMGAGLAIAAIVRETKHTFNAVAMFSTIVFALVIQAVPDPTTFTPSATGVILSLLVPMYGFVAQLNRVWLREMTPHGSILFTPFDTTCYTYLACSLGCVALYFLLAAYLDQVMPHATGTRKHPLFFLPSFLSKCTKKSKYSTLDAKQAMAFCNPTTDPTREPVSDASERNVAIRLANLSKHYSSLSLSKKGARVVTKAVDCVHLDMYAGEIFGLLGHNGAGKSTTFAMLCGMTEVTSGTAYVYGSDIRSDMPHIRQALGYVPQHDILIPNFTVDQHVRLIAQVKGIDTSSKAFTMTYDDYLAQLDVTAHRRKLASNLSGGQKRKMMLMMALVTDPRVLLLDEVTSGMDSASRRRVWDLISATKQSRFTLLSTHSMDEADVLADRKAIMNKGCIVCVGTSSFLKSLYRIGHRLEVSASSHAILQRIDATVRSIVPGTSQPEIAEHVSSLDAKWALPDEASADLPSVLDAVETLIRDCELQDEVSVSVSVSSLEDIFLAVTMPDKSYGASEEVVKVVNETTSLHSTLHRNLLTLLWLRLLLRLRAWPSLVLTFLVPLVLLAIVTSPLLFKQGGNKPTPVLLTSSFYSGNLVVFRPDGTDVSQMNACVLDELARDPRAVVVNDPISKEWFKARPVTEDYQGAYGLTEGHFAVYFNYRKTMTPSITLAILQSAFASCARLPDAPMKVTIADVEAQRFDTPFTNLFGEFENMESAGKRYPILFMLGFVVLFTPLVSFAGTYVRERDKRLLHTLYVMGVRRAVYWVANTLVDFSFMAVTCAVIVSILVTIPVFDSYEGIAGLAGTMLIGSLACVLFYHVVGHLFQRESIANKMTPLIALMLPVFLNIVLLILLAHQYAKLPEDERTEFTSMEDMPLNKTLGAFLVLTLPTFGLSRFFFKMASIWTLRFELMYRNVLRPTEPFKLSVALSNYKFGFIGNTALTVTGVALVFLGQAILYVCVLLLADWYRTGVRTNVRPVDASEQARRANERNHIDPPNVTHERTRLLPSNNARDTIKVRNITKTFNQTKVVDDVTFGVSKGECFGLLGPNGAGKSTTMNMITAEFAPDEGSISFENRSIFEDIVAARQKIGYCPQKNVLWDDLTLEEHLRLFASLKGVPASAIDAWIDAFLDALDIRHYRAYATKKLSGGNQRKVCFGIAFVGKPAVAVLDEASTGLDVAARLHMLKIMRAFKNDSAMVLVTHNMEEAERLCSRVAILVNGRVSVLGSAQQLKHQLGFCVELHGSDMAALGRARGRLVEVLPGATVSEEFGPRVKFHVLLADVRSVGLGNMFRLLEELKNDPSMRLNEYLVTHETMERVFLDAVAGQTDRTAALSDQKKMKKKKWLCV